MTIYNRKEGLTLFLGDIFVFIAALWLTLWVRYLELPSSQLFLIHLAPFSVLFVVWTICFYIAGLYAKNTLLFKSRLPNLILRVQIWNSILSVLFFYFISYFSIAPKVVLFIDLIFSFVLVLLWRLQISTSLGFRKKQKAIMIGEGDEMKELLEEVNHNRRYALSFVATIDLRNVNSENFHEVAEKISSGKDFTVIVADIKNKKIESLLPTLYRLIPKNIQIVEVNKLYTEIFDRIPLSMLRYEWFLENISPCTHLLYDALKRMMDLCIAAVLEVLSLILYPFVIFAVKLDDRGNIFLMQDRIGKGNKVIRIIKFRTMANGKVTRVGNYLRKTRIDELPQLWNVIRGDLSLIGPRPELPHFVELYDREIPYYNIRHLITPGLSGWAQTHHDQHPHHEADTMETKNKLSYDLYYIKNRSLMLDVKIALLTIRTLLSRSGI